MGPYFSLIISMIFPSECKLVLYADDSTIMYSHRHSEFISLKLGKELDSDSEWLIDNKLFLHIGKTECIR